MKKILKKFAIWLLEKTDEQELKSMKLNLKTEINLGKLLVRKNKWYHMAVSFEVQMRRSNKNEDIIQRVIVYRDGEVVDKYLLDN